MDEELRENILNRFEPFIDELNPLAILVFGSHASQSSSHQSDIDICIVAGKREDIDQVLSKAWQTVGGRFDLWIFEELPIYMQSEILDNHDIIYCHSEPELYEYLYTYRKLAEEYKYRLKVAFGEF